jgi:hypothetical protein
MVPLAIDGRALASGVREGVGVARAGDSCAGETGLGDGDLFGDGAGDPFVFFFGDGLGDTFAFFFFFDGVGAFFAGGLFFFGDALGFGVGDLAGLGEAFATLWGVCSDETCA